MFIVFLLPAPLDPTVLRNEVSITMFYSSSLLRSVCNPMPDRNPMQITGAIYGLAPASNKIISKQTGQWNTFEIQVID